MPKISESTVAEHRAAQQRAVLEAAERLIVASDGQVPSIAEVATEVGLARSSVYLYTTSRTDLLIQLLIASIEKWTVDMTTRMADAGDDSAARLDLYVDATLGTLLSSSHGALISAAQQYPETFTDERVQKAHKEMESARTALLGEVSPLSLPLIDAAIQRGAELVSSSNADQEAVRRALQRMARASLGGAA